MTLIGGDAINEAMVDGLKTAIRDELKDMLMKTAEEQVESIVDDIAKRLEANIVRSGPDPISEYRKIKLEVVMAPRKEPE